MLKFIALSILIFLGLVGVSNAAGLFGNLSQVIQIDERLLEALNKSDEELLARTVSEARRKEQVFAVRGDALKITDERLTAEREAEQAILDNLAEVATLKEHAQNLADSNKELKSKLERQRLELAELSAQLEADKDQIRLREDLHEKKIDLYNDSFQKLQNEKAKLALDQEKLQKKTDAYQTGLWASLGAIFIGLLTVVMKLPTARLEKEKLRKEILLIDQQLGEV